MNLCLPQEILASQLATDNFLQHAWCFHKRFLLPYFPILTTWYQHKAVWDGWKAHQAGSHCRQGYLSPAQRLTWAQGFPAGAVWKERGLAHEDVNTRQGGAWIFSPTQMRWAESPSWPWKHNWGWTVNIWTKASYHLTPMVLRSTFIFLASWAQELASPDVAVISRL